MHHSASPHLFIFYLVERDVLEDILKEQKLSLSGLVNEDTGPEIGEISGVSAFISGKIIAQGNDFRISLELIDASTSRVLSTYAFTLEKKSLIKAADDYRYSFVAPNGIGLSAGYTFFILDNAIFNNSNQSWV